MEIGAEFITTSEINYRQGSIHPPLRRCNVMLTGDAPTRDHYACDIIGFTR
jgi:hypothetical protein